MEGEEIAEITAADTNDLYGLLCEQERKNKSLFQIRKRLQEYQKQIVKVARDEELLQAKMRFHDELGRTLMQTRRALLDDKGEDAVLEALDSWKKTITIFDLGERRTKTKDPLTYLIQTANAVGVKLVFLGDFPKEQEIRELAVKIAAEALTNAVRHADARKLRIESKKENGWQILSFQNDGNKPKGPIEPVGGLAGLIRQIEAAGGVVTIEWTPKFSLTVKLICTC